jgi:hypothetical protein
MNEEETIDALITETLPPHLQQLDKYVAIRKSMFVAFIYTV